MRKGEEVYFFDCKRTLKRGFILRNDKGMYTIRSGRKNYKRRIGGIGRIENGIRKNKTNTAGMEKE